MSEPVPSVTLAPDDRVHLVGIGGAGMSALARILLERGHRVSGSDLRGGGVCTVLEAMGAVVHVGHDAAHVADVDTVTVSTAVPEQNPEVARARELGLPVLHRADLLEALMVGRRRVLIAGTHGKTTTTSMTAVCLQRAGLDPSFAIGGTLHDAGTSAHHGTGETFVAEADEAYRSFLRLTADCAVVTNIELDHHDEYADDAAVMAAFEAFVGRRSGAGPVIVCADDPGAATLADVLGEDALTYGETASAAVRITDVTLEVGRTAFRLAAGDEDLGSFELRLPGRHNIANATAALLAARWAGADLDACHRALAGFSGAQRRWQRLGSAAGVTVVDDYGHHPTELSATLAAARQVSPDGRVVAVFQPHRYSRTAALASELGAALATADVVVVSEIYASSESPVPGVSGQLVADAAGAGGATVRFVPAVGDLADVTAGLVRSGDLVLTLGAGDITEVGPQLLRRLEGRRG